MKCLFPAPHYRGSQASCAKNIPSLKCAYCNYCTRDIQHIYDLEHSCFTFYVLYEHEDTKRELEYWIPCFFKTHQIVSTLEFPICLPLIFHLIFLAFFFLTLIGYQRQTEEGLHARKEEPAKFWCPFCHWASLAFPFLLQLSNNAADMWRGWIH